VTIQFLRRIPFLKSLSKKNLREILKIARVYEYPSGSTIFSKPELADQMFIVLSGRVKIFTPSLARKRKILAYLETGNFFGEMALLDGKTRSTSAQAVTNTRLLVVWKGDFKKLLASNPKLTLYLLRTVCEHLRRADSEIEALLFCNVLGRVSKTLSELSQRGEKFRSGILLKEHYSQQELADLIGTTREPLTRALSSLRRAELLGVHHGRYFLKDPKRLFSIVEG
jgi:CRP/FNR family transcriptional regulator